MKKAEEFVSFLFFLVVCGIISFYLALPLLYAPRAYASPSTVPTSQPTSQSAALELAHQEIAALQVEVGKEREARLAAEARAAHAHQLLKPVALGSAAAGMLLASFFLLY